MPATNGYAAPALWLEKIADFVASEVAVFGLLLILGLVQTLAGQMKTAVGWITHDLAVDCVLADRINVMYSGRLVEAGATADVLSSLRILPCTRGLLRSLPSQNCAGVHLAQIAGAPP